MIKSQDYTWPVRESAVGHWKFRDNLNDESGNDNHLSGNIVDADYNVGYSERNNTSCAITATHDVGIPDVDAADFDFGTDDFSISFIHRTIRGVGYPIRKRIGNIGWVCFTGASLFTFNIYDSVTENNFTCAFSDFLNGLWHHVQISVDRGNNQCHIYFDGVEDTNSPFTITTAGSLSSTADLEIGVGYIPSEELHIDEIEICSGEVLTGDVASTRALGIMNFIGIYQEGFLLKFFPDAFKNNADLVEFLIAFNYLFMYFKYQADHIPDFISYNKCPERLLSSMVSTVGFELLESATLTMAERRDFVKHAVWLYKNKGTLACIDKIFDLLGFPTTTVVETNMADVPSVINSNKFYSVDDACLLNFEDDFSSANLSKWLGKQTAADIITIESGRLKYVSGAAGGGEDNGFLFESESDSFRLAVDMDFSNNTNNEFAGIMLNWTDYDDQIYVYLFYNVVGGHVMSIIRNVAGSGAVLKTITHIELLHPDIDFTGTIRLWGTLRNRNESPATISAGIDNHTIVFDIPCDMTGFSGNKKGIFVEHVGASKTVYFDNIKLHHINPYGVGAIFYGSTYIYRVLDIDVIGNPTNKTARYEYAKKIVPNYIPFGITIDWSIT